MKKIVYIITGICLAGLLFCSCMRQTKNEKEYSHEMGKWSSQIAGVFDSPVLAYMDSIIAYLTSDNLCFYDTKEDKIVKSRLLEENEAFLEISAGKEYFYVLVEKKAADALSIHPGPFYLKLYYPDGSMYQEISMPFQRMFVSDGMIYAYWEPDYSMEAYERKKGHIEATHYLSEKDFLSNFSNKVSDWNQMSGDTLKIVFYGVCRREISDCSRTDDGYVLFGADVFHDEKERKKLGYLRLGSKWNFIWSL